MLAFFGFARCGGSGIPGGAAAATSKFLASPGEGEAESDLL